MEHENEEDTEFLIQNIRTSIQVVIDKLDIAYIDKNTESRLINMCLQDKRCQKGQYDSEYLENMIERELIEAMW
jgi:dissimilatory sulfite reductase (desulfoviridin) alpha/beta subunit